MRNKFLPVVLLFILGCTSENKQETFYPNGNIKESQVETRDGDGNINAVYKSFSEEGKLSVKKHLVNGKLNGKYYRYYPSGELEAEFDYINGSVEGFAIFYAKDGRIEQKSTYVNNKEFIQDRFWPDGTRELSGITAFDKWASNTYLFFDKSGNIDKDRSCYVNMNWIGNDQLEIKLGGYFVDNDSLALVIKQNFRGANGIEGKRFVDKARIIREIPNIQTQNDKFRVQLFDSDFVNDTLNIELKAYSEARQRPDHPEVRYGRGRRYYYIQLVKGVKPEKYNLAPIF